jgi:hypothetical protein
MPRTGKVMRYHDLLQAGAPPGLVNLIGRMLAEESLKASGGKFYHGTAAPPSVIEAEGLKPNVGKGADAWIESRDNLPADWKSRLNEQIYSGTRQKSVYLTPHEPDAERFAALAAIVNKSDEVYVYTIEPPAEALEELEPDEALPTSFRWVGDVPSSWIKGHKSITGQALATVKRAADSAAMGAVRGTFGR